MKKISLILAFTFLCLNLFSQIDTFLSWGVSARAIGMGRSNTSVSDDGSSIFYNPSLLSKVKVFEFLGNYSLFYEGDMYGFFSFVSPTPYGTAGIAVQNLSVGGILLRDSSARPLGQTDARFTSIYFSYGVNLNELFLSSKLINLYLGTSAKLISQKLHNAETGGLAVDLGSQIDFDFGFYKFLCGINLVNMISSSLRFYTEEKIPFIFRVGIGVLMFDDSFKISLDSVQSKQIKDISLGLEYTLWRLFSIRSGFNNKELTLGLGITRQNIQFNYAFILNRPWKEIDFGTAHTFDFKIRWSLRKK